MFQILHKQLFKIKWKKKRITLQPSLLKVLFIFNCFSTKMPEPYSTLVTKAALATNQQQTLIHLTSAFLMPPHFFVPPRLSRRGWEMKCWLVVWWFLVLEGRSRFIGSCCPSTSFRECIACFRLKHNLQQEWALLPLPEKPTLISLDVSGLYHRKDSENRMNHGLQWLVGKVSLPWTPSQPEKHMLLLRQKAAA